MPDPTEAPERKSGSPGTAWLGGILIALGLIFFLSQQLNIDLTEATWPFYVIAPGVAALAFGLTQARGSGLAIFGSVVTLVGLVLLYQNATNHWESWAYAWALVGPGGSGVGMLLYGTRSRDTKMARDGFWQILSALGIFAVGLVFFEGVIGISGRRLPLPEWSLPVAIIVIGILVLLRGLTTRRQVVPGWDAEPEAAATSDATVAATDADEPPKEG